jgi:hypothetical protein
MFSILGLITYLDDDQVIRRLLRFEISIPGDSVIRASPVVLGMWFWTVKFDEENPGMPVRLRKMVLALQKCACCHGSSRAQHLQKAPTESTYRNECNKYDLTATQCFWLAHHNDWSGWIAFSSFSMICCPSSVSWVGLQ